MDNFGFLKVAAAIPSLRVGDCDFNAERIVALAEEAAQKGVEIAAFPALSLTGSTCGDLFLQSTLLDAAEQAIAHIVRTTRKLPLVIITGAPMRYGSALYNCAVISSQGRILGVVPKNNITLSESRWFASGAGLSEDRINVAGLSADLGADLSFDINGAEFAVEIGEDIISRLTPDGAKVIFNLAAQSEEAGRYACLRQLVAQQSARTLSGYIYCSAGFGESSTDFVFAGGAIIAENGEILREAKRFSIEEQLVVADIDIQKIDFDRRRSTIFLAAESSGEGTVIEMEIPESLRASALDRYISPTPFVPQDKTERNAYCEEVFEIQSHGLAKRLLHIGCKRAVIGVSGGLDSTLALLATVRTFDKLGLDREGIIGITMPGFGTTDRTYDNAIRLMRSLGVTVREISIKEACEQHFKDIGLDSADRSATYENAQARERTQILMDIANMEGGIVVGTGNMSEMALGWTTYNGDQMSMYGLNASVPKTLIRYMIARAANSDSNEEIRLTLSNILATPVSPELLPSQPGGEIAQKTEEIIGSYELHDFFLYHFIRSGFSAAKILFLAEQAFAGKYERVEILRRLTLFFERFFSQQFKRSAMPDSPQVGSVSLSPRGGLNMPSDASAEVWLKELKSL